MRCLPVIVGRESDEGRAPRERPRRPAGVTRAAGRGRSCRYCTVKLVAPLPESPFNVAPAPASYAPAGSVFFSR